MHSASSRRMQTVHCVPIHSGEYFHGAFETCDKDLAILLFKSIGRTRPVDERAERFLNSLAVIIGLSMQRSLA